MASNDQFILIQIGNQTFELPIQGANPSWAEELSAIIRALAEISQIVVGANDILPSTATILNNQTNVNFGSVLFDTAEVLSFRMVIFIVRQHNPGSGLIVLTQSGTVEANYDGSNWKLQQEYVGDAGVRFSITAGGVVQYSSTDLTGHITGSARYTAKTLDEEI